MLLSIHQHEIPGKFSITAFILSSPMVSTWPIFCKSRASHKVTRRLEIVGISHRLPCYLISTLLIKNKTGKKKKHLCLIIVKKIAQNSLSKQWSALSTHLLGQYETRRYPENLSNISWNHQSLNPTACNPMIKTQETTKKEATQHSALALSASSGAAALPQPLHDASPLSGASPRPWPKAKSPPCHSSPFHISGFDLPRVSSHSSRYFHVPA